MQRAAAGLLLLLTLVGAETTRNPYYLLSGDVVPLRYAVHLAPRLPQGGSGAAARVFFDGAVDVAAYATRATRTIVMHAAQNIKIASVSVKRADLSEVPHTIATLPALEFLIIYLEENLEVKEAINIQISYSAEYPDRMEGFYKSTYKYTTSDGEEYERVLFATHFEPTFARKALPVFDEPGYKATFQLTVDPPPGFNALSNTPMEVRKFRHENGREIDTIVFQETPRMSVHLLALLVYEEISYSPTPTTNTIVPVTSWAPKFDIDAGQAELSQSEAPELLAAMEEYTGVPFAQGNVSKLDAVAIPDLGADAMENWGLVAFREDALLVDPSQGSAEQRQSVAEAIAHEIAHQWFGNLVTPERWDYVWLSEGLARCFQFWLPGQLNPDWRMEEQLVINAQQSVFEADAMPAAVPLTTVVYTPSEIVERFGAISYNKGCAILRMVKNILGEENFQNALKFYLQENQFNSATPGNLFAAFERFTPEDVSPKFLRVALQSWTLTPGFPVLTVEAWNANTVFVTQKRFNLSAEDSYTSKARELYFVQYQIQEANGASSARLWSTPESSVAAVVVGSTEQWLVLNSTGYFRVNYWEDNWLRLGAALRAAPGTLAPAERAQLLDDALALARAALLPYVTTLDFARYLARETDYAPWAAAFPGLDFLQRLLHNDDHEGLFPAFLLELLGGVYAQLGFAAEGSHLERLLRAQVLGRACGAGHADCLADAQRRLHALLHEGQEVEPDLRSVVYCYGVKEEGYDVWEKLLGRLLLTDVAGERRLLISALGCSGDDETLRMYLDLSLDPNVVRSQDAAAVFTAVYTNPRGIDLALDFLVNRFADIQKAYGNIRDINNIVRGIAEHLSTQIQEQKMLLFLRAQASVLGESGDAAESAMRANVKWLSDRKEEVLSALRSTNLL